MESGKITTSSLIYTPLIKIYLNSLDEFKAKNLNNCNTKTENA
jgi:hypothetical protein